MAEKTMDARMWLGSRRGSKGSKGRQKDLPEPISRKRYLSVTQVIHRVAGSVTGQFILDRERINDRTVSLKERTLERTAKGSAFDLEDEELTHYGQSLSNLDDVGLRVEEGENGQIDKEIVRNTHFGGFGHEDEDEVGEEPARKKTKAEVMTRVIAKSKEHKDLDYDQHARELDFDKRSKPKDRTKTGEELVFEQREALEKAELKKQRRRLKARARAKEKKRKRGGDNLKMISMWKGKKASFTAFTSIIALTLVGAAMAAQIANVVARAAPAVSGSSQSDCQQSSCGCPAGFNPGDEFCGNHNNDANCSSNHYYTSTWEISELKWLNDIEWSNVM
ncbi:Nop14-like family-domain-containing protein [Amanita rubescens]|nr:Nop14-like family-domain-containing protein [Amanita rubescens]